VRWVIGENLAAPGCGAIRNMKNPGAFGDPDRMLSPAYYKGSDDNGGVHINSGVNNKAAFLMTDGGTFNGKTVTGLGIPKVAKIYYEVQTNLLVSGSDYADLYDALYQACSNLVGTSGITGADCQEVRDATDAVEMSKQPRPNFNTDAALCNGVGQPTYLFVDNIDDSGSANFRFQGNMNSWSLAGFYASEGSLHLYADDSISHSNDSAQMILGVALPAGSNPYLRFAHAFGFEDPNFDGGVLEYSIDNGTTFRDAGSFFDVNGYNGTINPNFSNSLERRRAFVADSHGYISSRVDLAAFAGEAIRFAWRIGTDPFFYDRGWFVDDIRIYTCSGGILQFSAAAFSVGEAGPLATITVTRTGSTEGTVEVSYATGDGTAGNLDYGAANGVLTFASGVASRTFTVPITNDTIDEANETIALTLSSPTNFATLGPRDTATLTITDNDTPGTIQLNPSYSVNEGAGAATIAVVRSGGSASGVSVSYATADGTALAGTDYTPASGTLDFGAGELTKSSPVTILNDGVAEGNKTFQVIISNPTGGATLGARNQAPVTINDDEMGLFFDLANYTVSESGPAATLTVRRSGPTAAAVGVSYAASDGTASAGLDYAATAGTLSLGPGVLSRTFTVPILNDTTAEGSESLVVSLSNPTGGALLGPQKTSVVTITDNDTAGAAQFKVSAHSVSEADTSVTIAVTRSGGTASGASVDFATADGTATAGSDYTAVSGTLTFGASETTKTFTIGILPDGSNEDNETLILTLGNATGGLLLGAPATAVLFIVDDE
jgi:hypothetical protein